MKKINQGKSKEIIDYCNRCIANTVNMHPVLCLPECNFNSSETCSNCLHGTEGRYFDEETQQCLREYTLYMLYGFVVWA